MVAPEEGPLSLPTGQGAGPVFCNATGSPCSFGPKYPGGLGAGPQLRPYLNRNLGLCIGVTPALNRERISARKTDVPTSAMNLSAQAQIIELLHKLQRETGLSDLFGSYDLKVVRVLCDRVIVLRHGKIMNQGLAAEVHAKPKTGNTKRLVRAAFKAAT